jgi:carboxylesterase type B
MSHNWFQTSQTGGQWYSDTSHFSFPCYSLSSASVTKKKRFKTFFQSEDCLHLNIFVPKDGKIYFIKWATPSRGVYPEG